MNKQFPYHPEQKPVPETQKLDLKSIDDKLTEILNKIDAIHSLLEKLKGIYK